MTKTKKSSPSKTKQLKTKAKNSSRKTAIILLSVVTGLLLLVLWVRADLTYSVNKNDARSDVQTVLDQVNPPAEQVYTDIVDRGCDSGSSVGLATVIHCDLVGYKFFENQGDLSANMKSVASSLEKDNWKASTSTPEASEANKQVLDGVQEGSVSYVRNQQPKDPWVELSFYKGVDPIRSITISDLIDAKKINTSDPNANIFGVRVTKTYWSCRSHTLVSLTCSFPPSKAEIR